MRGERKDWRLERRYLGKGKYSYGIVKVQKVHGGGSNGEADCLGGDCDVPVWAEE